MLIAFAYFAVATALCICIAAIIFFGWPEANSRFRRTRKALVSLFATALVAGMLTAPSMATGGTAKGCGEAPPSDPPVDRLYSPSWSYFYPEFGVLLIFVDRWPER